MTDASNPAAPWDGRPENPEKDGLHWLKCPEHGEVYAWWDTEGWQIFSAFYRPQSAVKRGIRYLGPCLTPAEVAAREQAAAAAMRSQCAGAADGWGRELFGDADDYKRGWNDACDEVALAIRALPLPTAALDAALEQARREERGACAVLIDRFLMLRTGIPVEVIVDAAAAIRARGDGA